jgi:hypothetical protein
VKSTTGLGMWVVQVETGVCFRPLRRCFEGKFDAYRAVFGVVRRYRVPPWAATMAGAMGAQARIRPGCGWSGHARTVEGLGRLDGTHAGYAVTDLRSVGSVWYPREC